MAHFAPLRSNLQAGELARRSSASAARRHASINPDRQQAQGLGSRPARRATVRLCITILQDEESGFHAESFFMLSE
jgi:hypothetical protein